MLSADLKVPIFADVWANGRQFYDPSLGAIVDEILAQNAEQTGPAAGPTLVRPD